MQNRTINSADNSKTKDSTIKDTLRIMKMVNNMRPSYIPLITFQALIAAVLPFISIIYGSKIIDGIVTRESKDIIISYVVIMVSLNLSFGLILTALDKKRKVDEQYIVKMNMAKLSEKSLCLDYEILEKKKTLELLKKAEDGSNSSGGLSGLCNHVVNLLQRVFSIIYALVLSIELFRKADMGESAWLMKFMNSPISSIVLFALIGIGILFHCWLVRKIQSFNMNSMKEM